MSMNRIIQQIKKITPSHLIVRYKQADQRSKTAMFNSAISLICRLANIVSQLLLVPLTINYVNPTQYGIWLTLVGIIGWVSVLDFGLAKGFGNRFTEARAKGDDELCRQYVSTTYFAITIVILLILIIVTIGNGFLNWAHILNVSESYRDELHYVFQIVISFTSLNMVANIFSTLLGADQKYGLGSLIYAVGQYAALFVIFILTKTTEGSLINLAMYYSGVPVMVLGLSSIVMFCFGPYKRFRPSLKYIRVHLIQNILKLGLNFLVINLCMIAIFQIINIVISREIGPESVTNYNIANKYFNLILMGMTILVAPYWAAFTDAYTKKEFLWMKNIMRKFLHIWLLCIPASIFMIFFSSIFYSFWVGDNVNIPIGLTIAMSIYILCNTYGFIFMTLLNGIGTIRIQMLIYLLFALVSWPLLTFFAYSFGIIGICIVPGIVYLIQGLFAYIQINKIINGTATGIWLK